MISESQLSNLVGGSPRPLIDYLGVGAGGAIGAAGGSALGRLLGSQAAERQHTQSLSRNQRMRLSAHKALQKERTELEKFRSRRWLRRNRPDLYQEIDLSDLPEKSPNAGRIGAAVGGGLGAIALGYAGKKLQDTIKRASSEDDDDDDFDPPAKKKKTRGYVRALVDNALSLTAGAVGGTAAGAVAGHYTMKDVGEPVNFLDPSAAARWRSDKRMVTNWLRRKGIRPNVISNSVLRQLGPHAVSGRTAPRLINEYLGERGVRSNYKPDTIFSDRNHTGVMMHEGGHIANFHTKKNLINAFVGDDDKADRITTQIGGFTRGAMPFYGSAAGVGLAAFGSKRLGRHAWALPLLGAAPLVGEETLAHIRGINEIRRQQGMGAAMSNVPTALKALGTYAAWPAGMSLAAWMMNRLKPDPEDEDDKIKKDKRKAKMLQSRARNRERREVDESVTHKAASSMKSLRQLAAGHDLPGREAKLNYKTTLGANKLDDRLLMVPKAKREIALARFHSRQPGHMNTVLSPFGASLPPSKTDPTNPSMFDKSLAELAWRPKEHIKAHGIVESRKALGKQGRILNRLGILSAGPREKKVEPYLMEAIQPKLMDSSRWVEKLRSAIERPGGSFEYLRQRRAS